MLGSNGSIQRSRVGWLLILAISVSCFVLAESKKKEKNNGGDKASSFPEQIVKPDIDNIPNENSKISSKITNSTHNVDENALRGFSALYGLTLIANSSLVNAACLDELRQIRNGAWQRRPWAMKALDASGTNTLGFMYRQNFWLGSREVCDTLNVPLTITLSHVIERTMKSGLLEEVAPFEMHFRVVYLTHNSPWQMQLHTRTSAILHLGLCLPQSCSSPEVHKLVEELMKGGGNLPAAELYEFEAKVLYVKDLKVDPDFYKRTSFKLFVVLLIFSTTMLLCGSFIRVDRESPEGMWLATKSLLKCFDVRQNCHELFNTKKLLDNEITAIHGVRSIAAFLVLFFHVMYCMVHAIRNEFLLLANLESQKFQLLNLLVYSVDIFFAISGFLLTYNFLRDSDGIQTIRKNSLMQNIKLFCRKLIHRYLRLAPLCIAAMITFTVSSAYIEDVSLFHIYEYNRYDEICAQYWWRNLLFIQSYFPSQQMCLSWTWSLSCEMQYFVVCSVLLFIYVKHPKLVKCSVVALFGFKIVWTLVTGTRHQFQFNFEAMRLTFDSIYLNPLLRGIPYLMGAICAWCFVTRKQPSLKISSSTDILLWHLTIVLLLGTACTMQWRNLDHTLSAFLYIMGRIMLSLAVCWLMVGNAMGGGCWWSRVLEAPVFQHISRVAFAIYMTNPGIIYLFAGLLKSDLNFDTVTRMLYSCGFSVIIYVVAIGFSLSFEVPYSNFSKRIFRENKKKIK